ncbi:substrate-binding domain-containing protein [Pararhodospirillum photometricum]|uniref:Putative sugar uptake ABC transporter periplasmic solute-binding protein n=1 Tax=Pararhodospirillum photometricum DSM 122 TaxID=1150469 RepID=H6SPC5_PARPM|nr:substrate-binding domain-containing protein [Pararhodospirillum photometricum]CCG09450.1 Putative sugar uptake ABC transporter periplasmic solute-binding protein [Pararhodospirillum photometricum DSM 122]
MAGMGRTAGLVLLALGLLPGSGAAQEPPATKGPVIGFSQATTLEPWRILFNEELRAEAAKHPEVTVLIADANDSVDKQVADMEGFIQRKVNAILITPKESAQLTPVVIKAADAGIPVFVLDRNVETDRITQFIGGDNRAIGAAAGTYAVKLLGGPGKAQGTVFEVWGGMKTKPSRDRHDGFYDVVSREPGIRFAGTPVDCDWKQHLAYEAMVQVLEKEPKIDLVYAHNDPMAYGAYLAARDEGRAQGIAFLGIDGIPSEGVRWVRDGVLSATFLYKTPGDEGLRQALRHLAGQPIEKTITLPTQVIDKAKAEEILAGRRDLP